MIRPSPGVTALQYFLMSRAQDSCRFWTLETSLSCRDFVTSPSPEAPPLQRTPGSKKAPTTTSKTFFLIVVPFQLAGVRVRRETPSDRLTPTEPSIDRGCSAIER